MTLWQFAIVVLATVAVLWTLAVIPLLLGLARMARRLEGLLREAEVNMAPAFLDVREAARHFNRASAGVADGVKQAGRVFEAVGEVGRTIQGANAILRTALGPTFGVALAVITGVREGSRFFLRRILRRR
jgi:hypothetical protein